MPFSNLGGIVRVLVTLLRRPEMKIQRRFVLITGIVLAIFFVWAVWFLFQQPTPSAEEDAAITIFLVAGVLITVLLIIAVIIRKKTVVKRGTDEALSISGKGEYKREMAEGEPEKQGMNSGII